MGAGDRRRLIERHQAELAKARRKGVARGYVTAVHQRLAGGDEPPPLRPVSADLPQPFPY
ncbi:hypothetical protein C1I95_21005 [Micromonospora craterilacus]|uniref:Uncharacterized protein n=1 Tax=Micromonospora craterilacus TaxID=1655439 RepID=A0A2W2DXD6_9ACTN|nr:hypothetical protein [Micromonospora craterilacus]PZG14791.1 hypothetical protein C1I95_21005 [Micromonospora craterilacus]